MHVTSSPLITGFSLASFVIVQTWPYVIVISSISRDWLYTLYIKRTEVDALGNMAIWREREKPGLFPLDTLSHVPFKSDFHNVAHLQAPTAKLVLASNNQASEAKPKDAECWAETTAKMPLFLRGTHIWGWSQLRELFSRALFGSLMHVPIYVRTYLSMWANDWFIDWSRSIDRLIEWLIDVLKMVSSDYTCG